MLEFSNLFHMVLNNEMNVEMLRTTFGTKSGKTCFNYVQI